MMRSLSDRRGGTLLPATITVVLTLAALTQNGQAGKITASSRDTAAKSSGGAEATTVNPLQWFASNRTPEPATRRQSQATDPRQPAASASAHRTLATGQEPRRATRLANHQTVSTDQEVHRTETGRQATRRWVAASSYPPRPPERIGANRLAGTAFNLSDAPPAALNKTAKHTQDGGPPLVDPDLAGVPFLGPSAASPTTTPTRSIVRVQPTLASPSTNRQLGPSRYSPEPTGMAARQTPTPTLRVDPRNKLRAMTTIRSGHDRLSSPSESSRQGGRSIALASTDPRPHRAAPQIVRPTTLEVFCRLGMIDQRDFQRPAVRTVQFESVADEVELVQNPRPSSEKTPDQIFDITDHTAELSVALRRSKLLRTRFDIYRTAVVDPSVCDVVQFTPREVQIIGKGQGATNVTFWFNDGEHRPLTYLVKVTPDLERRKELEEQFLVLERILLELFPDSKVSLVPVADKLIVRGQAKDSEEAARILEIVRGNVGGSSTGHGSGLSGDGMAANVLTEEETGRPDWPRIQIINMLHVPGVQQVALRVKIAELNRTAARSFGVDIDARFEFDPNNAILMRSLLNAAVGGSTSLLGSFDANNINFGVHYLQQHGVLRVLSEPTLVTMSGHPATFVAGGEFAVPTVVGAAGLNAITTDFRSFGVIVSFLPTVVDKDRIRLQVAPEFSKIDEDLQVGDTPGLDVRAVTTTVEMREGQTLAIAGLLDDAMSGQQAGNVPWLERLFGHRDMTRNETELIILVTPELVSPMDPEEVPPLPGFDVTEPSDGQFYLHGEIEGTPTIEHRSTVWPRLRQRYRAGGPAMISGPFGHGE
jgi:pilus assembly protein CpaC